MKTTILVLIVVSMFLAGCATGIDTIASNTDENTDEQIQEDENMKTSRNAGTIVKLETNQGDMKIKLYDEKAPITTDNFKKLVGEGFYDGTIFHRVIPNFMIQGGDPTGTGMGDPGYKIEDEFHPDLKHSKAGILSMANAGPNTGGSQFFITVAATPHLDGRHSVFGEIIEGLDVAIAISELPRNGMDKPNDEVKIVKASIEE